MKTTNLKPKVDSLPDSESQAVEMIVYFDGHESEHRAFFATFDMEHVRDLMQINTRNDSKFENFRKELNDYLLQTSLQSFPDPVFYNVSMSYLSLHESVKEELINYPNGGWAVIGNFNYNEPSLLKVSIIHPDEFSKQRNADNSIKPFNGNKTGITLSGDSVICTNINEALFLSCLVELIKDGENNCCHHSNEDLLRMIPVPLETCDRVAQLLGKFEKLGVIGSIIYNSKGQEWYRDLFLKFPANHILFSEPDK